MARPLRLEFSGALYHITSRGDRREDIYLTDNDRNAFLKILGEVCERYNWIVHAYCLMDNHYHILIETPDGNLARGMRHLNGVYTQYFNRAHKRVGHVYQGRYKAIIIQKETYLLEVARYIVLNPVRALMVRTANDWHWSSYRATSGHSRAPEWLNINRIIAHFSKDQSTAIDRYRRFVAEGKNQPSIWEQVRNQVYIGDPDYIEQIQAKITIEPDLGEIPERQRRPVPISIEYYARKYKDRDRAIRAAYQSGGYSMKDLGIYFDLHYSSFSRIINGKYAAK
jgi:REP element-mobilizing transposase RayT